MATTYEGVVRDVQAWDTLSWYEKALHLVFDHRLDSDYHFGRFTDGQLLAKYMLGLTMSETHIEDHVHDPFGGGHEHTHETR